MAMPARLLLFVPAVLTAQQYFPVGVLDAHEVDRYTRQLKAMREPSLYELARQDPGAEVYRFLWLRSHQHPIAIRLVVRKNGSGWINARMTTLGAHDEPGGIRRYSVSWLTRAKTQSLLAAFESAGFWNLPTDPPANGLVSLDGAQWIFEGVRGGQYHIIDRWSPKAGDPARVIGTLALKLARFRIRPDEVY
jgi:hypothetical protein